MTFADKPWRPADHPSPGPSWRAHDQVLESSDRSDLLTGSSGVSPFAPLPGPSTADGPDYSAGIALQRRYQVTGSAGVKIEAPLEDEG